MMRKISLFALFMLISLPSLKCAEPTRCEELDKAIPPIFLTLFPMIKDIVYNFTEWYHPEASSAACKLDKLTDMQWKFITEIASAECVEKATKAAFNNRPKIDRCQFMRDMQNHRFSQPEIDKQMRIFEDVMDNIFPISTEKCGFNDIPEQGVILGLKVFFWAAIQTAFQCAHDNIPVVYPKKITPPPLTDEQTAELKIYYSLFDKDGDNKISKEEYSTTMKTRGQDLTEKEVQKMLKDFDTSGDGTISYDEFVIMWYSSTPAPPAAYDGDGEIRKEFEEIDADSNEYISVNELIAYVAKAGGWELTVSDATEVINGVDSDGDGQVSYQEFKAAQ